MSDKYAVPNKLPATQVSILAHRKKRIVHDQSLHTLKSKNIRRSLHRKKIGFHKAEYFVSKYLLAERDAKRVQRKVLRRGLTVKLPAEQKLLAVLRFRAKVVASKSIQAALDTLGVGRMNRASLVEANTETKALLSVVEPYITYGVPNINTVRELVFKHGFIQVNDKRVPIQSNVDIENELGSLGIICVEDIVHELFTVGPSFNEVRKLIGSFKLNPPRDGWTNKRGKSFDKGGEYGNRDQEINDLLSRCM